MIKKSEALLCVEGDTLHTYKLNFENFFDKIYPVFKAPF